MLSQVLRLFLDLPVVASLYRAEWRKAGVAVICILDKQGEQGMMPGTDSKALLNRCWLPMALSWHVCRTMTWTVPILLAILSPWPIHGSAAAEESRPVFDALKDQDDGDGQHATQILGQAGPATGDSFLDCPVCPEMIIVPAGSFFMGSSAGERGQSPDEAPRHQVTITAPFAIGKYEVTRRQWRACLGDGGCLGYKDFPDEGSVRRPATGLSWLNIPSFLAWLNGKSGQAYRLPTEAEWEYVARAGSTTAYAFGDDLTSNQANFGDHIGLPAVVGSYAPNAWGVYDMHGNAAEWVEDCWINSYAAPADGSAWTPDCLWRAWRGGHWASDVGNVRSASRDHDRDGAAGYHTGFRVVRSVPP